MADAGALAVAVELEQIMRYIAMCDLQTVLTSTAATSVCDRPARAQSHRGSLAAARPEARHIEAMHQPQTSAPCDEYHSLATTGGIDGISRFP